MYQSVDINLVSSFSPLNKWLDPTFIVSHKKDFYRQARKSAIATAQCTVHPIYQSMFSDLKKYRRVELVCHPNARLPNHMTISYPRENEGVHFAREVNIEGKQRALFFTASRLFYPPAAKLSNERAGNVLPEPSGFEEEERVYSKGVQTLFRESSAQTESYQPDYYISKKCKDIPEILLVENVDSCHIGNVMSVERQRVRRAWLKKAMSFKVLSQLESDDYNYRQKELEEMLLMEERKLGAELFTTLDKNRLKNLWAAGTQRLQSKITRIKHDKERNLRKIEVKHKQLYGTKKTVHCPSSFVRKPMKIAVSLDYLPEENDFKFETLDLNPRVPNNFKECDKFAKRRERQIITIKKELKKILEPDEDLFDDMSWGGVDETVVEEEIPEVTKEDKSTGVNFFLEMLEARLLTKDEVDDHLDEIKKKVIISVSEALNKDADQVMEEGEQGEVLDSKDGEDQEVKEIVKKALLKKFTKRDDMYKEIAKIRGALSATMLDEIFTEVSWKIAEEKKFAEKVEEIEEESYEPEKEMTWPEIIADMILSSVMKVIDKKEAKLEKKKKDKSDKKSPKDKKSPLIEGMVEPPIQDLADTQLQDVDQGIGEALEFVQAVGSGVIDTIFFEVSKKMSGEEFKEKYGAGEGEASMLRLMTSESFIRDVLMNELLPEVIEELRRAGKLSDFTLTDYDVENMVKVVHCVQDMATNVLNTIIRDTTHEPIVAAKKKKTSANTLLKRAVIADIIMDTLMPGVAEEIQRRYEDRESADYEKFQLAKVMKVVQNAASDILNWMFTAQPEVEVVSSDEPIESYVKDWIVEALPRKIRVEIDPRYFFETGKGDTNESFVWDLIVSSLPQHIQDDLEFSKDITQMNKMVVTIHKAASEMFKFIFDEVSEQIEIERNLPKSHSQDSFFMEIFMGAIMPQVMGEIDRKEKKAKEMDPKVLRVLERAAYSVLDDMLNVHKPQEQRPSTTSVLKNVRYSDYIGLTPSEIDKLDCSEEESQIDEGESDINEEAESYINEKDEYGDQETALDTSEDETIEK